MKAMKKSEAKVYKERLIDLRARMRGDVSALATAALEKNAGSGGSMPIHMADAGTDNYEQEFSLSFMEKDEVVLEQIEAALERIEDGIYGACVTCERKIPKTRLNAIPHTPNCVNCASQLESR